MGNEKQLVSVDFPLVLVNDDGIRPAGPQDACLYCRSKVGEQHKVDCVIITKKVRLRYSFDIEVEVPYSWNVQAIEFQRNEGSWCANNAISELVERYPRTGLAECPCSVFTCEYLSTVDAIPRGHERKTTNGDVEEAGSDEDSRKEPEKT